MLPVAVRQPVKLRGNPQVGGLFTAGRAGSAVTGVGDVSDVRALRVVAGILFHAADAGAAGQHFCDGFDFDITQAGVDTFTCHHGGKDMNKICCQIIHI